MELCWFDLVRTVETLMGLTASYGALRALKEFGFGAVCLVPLSILPVIYFG